MRSGSEGGWEPSTQPLTFPGWALTFGRAKGSGWGRGREARGMRRGWPVIL